MDPSWTRSLVARGTYPALLLVHTLAVAWVIEDHPGDRAYETFVVTFALFATTVALLFLQRWQPAVESWRDWKGDLPVDLAHGLISATLGTVLARAVLFGVVPTGGEGGWPTLWPSHWPLLAQLPLAVVISDFGMYALHRASHAFPILWRFHAVHHSSERMYTVSSGRVHPLYVALAAVLTTGPILALGAPPQLFALLSTFVGTNGLVQHSNLNLDCRPFRWLIATADAHRWHHSVDPSDGTCNFGNTLSWWDRLFGTWRVRDELPEAVGLREEFPRGWLGQLAKPFLRQPQWVFRQPE
jgi:sterol desaturase/sphingolipid hydroxylase (fatty acid hydroxylase superfamily)